MARRGAGNHLHSANTAKSDGVVPPALVEILALVARRMLIILNVSQTPGRPDQRSNMERNGNPGNARLYGVIYRHALSAPPPQPLTTCH